MTLNEKSVKSRREAELMQTWVRDGVLGPCRGPETEVGQGARVELEAVHSRMPEWGQRDRLARF